LQKDYIMRTLTKPQAQTSRPADQRQQRPTPAGADVQAIRARAYHIYQSRNRNGVPGDALSDWLEAEREIKALSRGEVLMRGDQD
jgi:hypothetical protein